MSKSKHDCTSHTSGRRARVMIRVVVIVRGTLSGKSSVTSKRVTSAASKSKAYKGKSSESKTKQN